MQISSMQCVYKMEIVVRNSMILEMCVRAAWGARGTSADNTLEVAGGQKRPL